MDGSRCLVHAVLQPLLRAHTVRLRPLHSHTTLLLADDAPGSTRMRQVMASVLRAVIGQKGELSRN